MITLSPAGAGLRQSKQAEPRAGQHLGSESPEAKTRLGPGSGAVGIDHRNQPIERGG